MGVSIGNDGAADDVGGLRPPAAVLELRVFVPVLVEQDPALLHQDAGGILQGVESETRVVSGHGSVFSRVT